MRCTSCVTSTIWVRRAVRTRIDCIAASRNVSGYGNDVMLAGFLGAGKLLQLAEAPAAEAQQERKKREIAGLEPFVRIKEVFQEVGMLVDDLFVAVERGTCLGAQFFHLVANPVLGAGDGC